LSSARTVSSSRDFGVEQFFRADEFRADDPSPKKVWRYCHCESIIEKKKTKKIQKERPKY
jgi:hypothetical protein